MSAGTRVADESDVDEKHAVVDDAPTELSVPKHRPNAWMALESTIEEINIQVRGLLRECIIANIVVFSNRLLLRNNISSSMRGYVSFGGIISSNTRNSWKVLVSECMLNL